MITLKIITQLFRSLIAVSMLFTFSSHAVPILFGGTDAGHGTANSDAAFTAWSNAVGSFTLDNLDGLTNTSVGEFTSSLGNTYTATDDLIGAQNFSFAVLDGISLRLTKSTTIGADNVTTFTWDIVDAVDSFGFFARNNDGGIVTINLNNGTSQSFSLMAESTNSIGDNLFWGVTDLDATVQSLTITSTEPITVNATTNNSNWDRFVYRSVVTVPEPGIIGLVCAGLIGFSIIRRKAAL